MLAPRPSLSAPASDLNSGLTLAWETGGDGECETQDQVQTSDTNYHILSDGVDNALSRGPEPLALRPAHLLEENCPDVVLSGELVLLVCALLYGGSTIRQNLNSSEGQTRPDGAL